MRIVQVCPYDLHRPGGVQRHILSLSQALRNESHEVLVVAPGPAPPATGVYYLGRQRQIGMSGTRFELTWAAPHELRSLRRWFETWKPDLLHFHTIWTPFMPLQVFRTWDGPVVATFHDTPPSGLSGKVLANAFKVMSRWLLGRIDAAIAVSEVPYAHLRKASTGVAPTIIPPAIDLHAVCNGSKKREDRDAGLHFLFVGRLEHRKGVADLLRAWNIVQRSTARASMPPVLTIAGKGELAKTVRDAQRRHGPDRLRFVEGPDAAALRQLFQDADVLVAPSPYGESFGIVLVEAMANRLPVIAAANPGYSRVLTGLGSIGLVPPADSRGLAAKILQFATDDALREKLSAWGGGNAWQYDIQTVLPKFTGIYERCLGRLARAGA